MTGWAGSVGGELVAAGWAGSMGGELVAVSDGSGSGWGRPRRSAAAADRRPRVG